MIIFFFSDLNFVPLDFLRSFKNRIHLNSVYLRSLTTRSTQLTNWRHFKLHTCTHPPCDNACDFHSLYFLRLTANKTVTSLRILFFLFCSFNLNFSSVNRKSINGFHRILSAQKKKEDEKTHAVVRVFDSIFYSCLRTWYMYVSAVLFLSFFSLVWFIVTCR